MIKTTLYKTALSALYYSNAFRASPKSVRGVGVLLTLHRVRPLSDQRDFAPNRILEITPAFLESTITQIKRMGYQFVSLDDFQRRLIERDFSEPFVSLTLDDGYADNYVYAFPVFQKHEVPFTIYVCTGLIDGSARLWWRMLEEVIYAREQILVPLGERSQSFEIKTTKQKYGAFQRIYWALRRMPHDAQMATIDYLERRYPTNAAELRGRGTAASWQMLAEMLDTGLLTVGAHTIAHDALSKLPESRVREEMAGSRDRVEKKLGISPEHFAYPYGDMTSASRREFEIAKSIGFTTAVTTRKGVVLPDHVEHLHALPRISLNGDYQQSRYVTVFLSGVPFYLARGLRRLDVN